MQLALFDPGRDYLQQHPSVLDALRMLTDKALTEDARQYAEGALMALLPPEAVAHHAIDVESLHVFMSYQWACQAIVERCGQRLIRAGLYERPNMCQDRLETNMRKEVERKAVFCRIVAELQGRGYIVWFDCELVAPLLSVALLSCRTGSERTGVGGWVISMQWSG